MPRGVSKAFSQEGMLRSNASPVGYHGKTRGRFFGRNQNQLTTETTNRWSPLAIQELNMEFIARRKSGCAVQVRQFAPAYFAPTACNASETSMYIQ